jgi:hypothetical protein
MASSINASTTAGVVTTADTSGVLNIQTAGTTAIAIDASQAVTFAGAVSLSGNQTTTGNLTVNGNTTLGDASTDTILMTGAPSIGGAGLGMGMGFRNRIINGAMVIDQRNAGASVTPNQSYTLDRWLYENTQTGKVTIQQNAGAVTPPTGFTNYLGVTSTSAYSVLSSDTFLVTTRIEGYNMADFAFGTASASYITLSFWVRSSLTGTFGGSFGNVNATRCFAFSYTINAANTWEQKTVTIAGDTSGTWNTTTGRGLGVTFGLGSGSTYTGTAGSWQSANLVQPTGTGSVVGTNGATWYVTGIQLEKGATATSFDYRPYGTEFALCQRYYETSYPVGYPAGYNFAQEYPFSTSKPLAVNFIASDDTTVSQSVRFVVVKRTSPTVVIYSAKDGASGFTWTYKGTGGTNINVAASATYTSENLWNINQLLGATNQANESYFHFTASAEL